MPRTARVAPNEYIYHALTRGNNRQSIFKDNVDYQAYLDIIIRYKDKYRFKLYHYVLMTNHVHLVIETTGKGGTLAEIMKGINLSYAQHYKRRYKHVGHFWQDRYKSILISKDDYLLACGSYVELNPVRAKITDDPKDYLWSSYRAYAYGRHDPLVDEHLIYRHMSDKENDRREKYREFVRGMLHERNGMKGEMEGKNVYGGAEFAEAIRKKFNVAKTIKSRGRRDIVKCCV
jgi:putative transposase